jgi:hypothetical protein
VTALSSPIYFRSTHSINHSLDKLKEYDNVTLKIDAESDKLMENIRKSKFICVFDKPCTIPFGLNNDIPLELSGMMAYDKSIFEIFDRIVNYTDGEYNWVWNY